MTDIQPVVRPGTKAGWVPIAVTFLTLWEGVSYTAKHQSFDPPGVITVCNGITNYDDPTLKAGDKRTKAQCDAALIAALPKYDACVVKYVKRPMTNHQHAMFVSFVYNEGCGNFSKSSIVVDFNAGRIDDACKDFLKYHFANGKSLQGLENRRIAECKEFKEADQ